jgi:hypothetical protein
VLGALLVIGQPSVSLIMKWTTFIISAALLAGCATTPDPIDRLVSRLSSDHSWERGDYFSLGLPASSSIEQVVSRVLELLSSDTRPVTTHKIIKVRKVGIPGSSLPGVYTAVLVDTGSGRKVVLLNHVGPDRDWWYLVFDEWSWPVIDAKKSA